MNIYFLNFYYLYNKPKKKILIWKIIIDFINNIHNLIIGLII